MSTTTELFRERSSCPLCANERCAVVWSGRFDAEPTRGWLERYGYSADVVAELGEAQFALVRCERCEFLHHRRVLRFQWLHTLYSKWIDSRQIERFEALLRASAFERGRQLVKHVLRVFDELGALPRAPRWLDFGCGDGVQLDAAELFGFEVFGVDFSATRSSRSYSRTLVPDLAAFDSLSVGPLDVASAFQVLEHVEQPIDLLRALAERLRPGGLLIVETPDARQVEVPATWEQFQVVQPLEHINAFTPATLRAACVSAGFEPLARKPAHVTTRLRDIVRTEASRWYRPDSTQQYFRRASAH